MIQFEKNLASIEDKSPKAFAFSGRNSVGTEGLSSSCHFGRIVGETSDGVDLQLAAQTFDASMFIADLNEN